MQINKIRDAKEEITTNTKEVQGIIRDYLENLYSNKFENPEEMDRFLDTYDHPKLNQEGLGCSSVFSSCLACVRPWL
jgi:hypothetical protein